MNLELLLQLPLCRTQLCVVTKLGLPRRLRRFLYPLPRLLWSVEARIFSILRWWWFCSLWRPGGFKPDLGIRDT